MIELDRKQVDRIMINLFHARYKSLLSEGLPQDVRFAYAIADTADDKIKLEEHPEIVLEWLKAFGKKKKYKKRAAVVKDGNYNKPNNKDGFANPNTAAHLLGD